MLRQWLRTPTRRAPPRHGSTSSRRRWPRPAALADILPAALAAADIAAVLLRLAPADERTLTNRVKALAPDRAGQGRRADRRRLPGNRRARRRRRLSHLPIFRTFARRRRRRSNRRAFSGAGGLTTRARRDDGGRSRRRLRDVRRARRRRRPRHHSRQSSSAWSGGRRCLKFPALPSPRRSRKSRNSAPPARISSRWAMRCLPIRAAASLPLRMPASTCTRGRRHDRAPHALAVATSALALIAAQTSPTRAQFRCRRMRRSRQSQRTTRWRKRNRRRKSR